MLVCMLLALLCLGCSARPQRNETSSEGSLQCATTSCSLQQSSVCNNLPGRESNYVSPQNLPQELSNQSLEIGSFALNFILELTQSSPFCFEYSIHLLCLVGDPPCDNSSQTPLLLCPETCYAYDKLIDSGVCDDFIMYVITSLQSDMNVDFIGFFDYFNDLNCSDPKTYFQNSTATNECENITSSCTNLFSPESQEQIIDKESLYPCERLSGSLCQTLFPDVFEYSIMVPGRVGTEMDTFDTLYELTTSLNTICNDWLTLTTCYYLHPTCTENGEQLSLCEGQCERIDQILEEECGIHELLASQNITTINPFISAFVMYNCSDPSSYQIAGVPVDNTSCLTMTDLLPTSTDAEDSLATVQFVSVIVVGVIVAAILVVLTGVVTFVCARKQTREKMKEMWMSQEVLRHFSFSRSLTQPSTRAGNRGNIHSLDNIQRANENKIRVLKLSTSEKQHFEQQFSGFVIKFGSLNIGDCIGQGAFGKVYSGSVSRKGTRETVAIKTVKSIDSEDQLKAFLSESLIMKDFKHPRILSLLGVCFDTPDGSPYIVLPFMANGSVKDFLKEKRVHPTNFDDTPVGLKVADLLWMCMEIAEGMKYLTENKFVHRDLAARNCMVNEEGSVLVGDFGLAREIYFADYYRTTNPTARLPVKWMAPETLNDSISNEKTDVWSYGVTCWEVFSLGRTPYPGIENHEILQHISSGGRLKKPSLCPDKLYNLVAKCWHLYPEDRPTFNELASLLKEYWDEEHLYVVQSYQENNNSAIMYA